VLAAAAQSGGVPTAGGQLAPVCAALLGTELAQAVGAEDLVCSISRVLFCSFDNSVVQLIFAVYTLF